MPETLFSRSQKRPMNQQSPIVAFGSFCMNDEEFNTLRELIYHHAAIEIRPHKKQLLINRLAKRLRHLGLQSFSQYLAYLEEGNHREQELIELIDAVTTNKTDFFREPKHFAYMDEQVIPEIVKTPGRADHRLHVWSAACSSGEEPYSIVISLSEAMGKYPGWSFDVLASDISETILRQAITGIYEESKISPIPLPLLRKYFLKGNKRYKVKPEAGRPITFKKINLKLDFHSHITPMDVIFCRNVLIYFNRETQQSIINKCWHVLRPGGFLFLGHSETLQGMQTHFKYILPSIYQREKE